ncbi:hypothetical protein Ppa06_00650 [Planomonospora parontospora subsp. parontospora]|uniref:DNA phosphorothioation-associated protein 4 n=2 Tax=Planomonospora parontospora TaxID=58119 RepID=A0AA37F239_9ACTN|nr:DNA phosphorothioation-associated protein 4 [Planomonospora parontospora]GGK44980.1 hypothetical protein GCM10010126_00650 [Planomonospora parontospora]GII06267.1 hypothetical protein Ppa06_00650 [Planomonospora parontospora subsp. parontospora]
MAADERFRRPAEHERLLNDLTAKDGPFRAMVDALMFAAALGCRKGRREPFEKAGEAIRLSLMEGRQYGDVLIDMVAASEVQDDPKILADDRLSERIKIFEDYANGGLYYLQGEINARGSNDLTAIVSSLVVDALAAPPKQEITGSDLLELAELDY